MPKPAFKIHVSPKTSPQYFDVYIHPTRRGLREAYGGWSGDVMAFCKPRFSPENALGELHFRRDTLSHGVIAHELFHALLIWARVTGGVPPVEEEGNAQGEWDESTNEERCAEIIGFMVAQFAHKLKRLRIKTVKETIYTLT